MERCEGAAAVREQPRLLYQVRNVIRRLHDSIRTEQAYVDWVRRLPVRFILFHGKRHPAEMGAFLTHLAVQAKVAASTQPAKVGTVFSGSDAGVMGGALR